jgi:hypothetical protein
MVGKTVKNITNGPNLCVAYEHHMWSIYPEKLLGHKAMKLNFLPVIPLGFSLFYAPPVSAETPTYEKPVIEVNTQQFNDFIPSGWQLESVVNGDVNRDGREDALIVLIEAALPPGRQETEVSGKRTLLVLLKSENGIFQPLVEAKHLLRCKSCYGALSGPDGGSPEIKITKGVITVEDNWGSRETVNTRLSFRYDPVKKKILLIGEDVEEHDRATGNLSSVSSNFLTRIKHTIKKKYDKKKDQMVTVLNKKQRIASRNSTIDAVNFEDY